MRRVLVYFVLALVAGGALGSLMTRDPGYVLLTYAGMSLETSLWFALLILIALYFVLRLIIRIGAGLMRGGAGIQSWQQNRRARNAHERTVRGLLLAGAGDWSGARKTLAAVAAQADVPLVNYLVAARAANELGDTADRDALLQKAGESTPDSTVTVACAQAEMQMAALQYQQAAATLLAVKDTSGQVRALQMLVQCYEAQAAWPELLTLAAELERRRAIAPEILRASLKRWWLGFFQGRGASADESTERLMEQWRTAGKDLRSDPELILAEVEALVRSGDTAAAEDRLRKALGESWHADLVARYGLLRSSQPDRQLGAAEGWLKGHPNDPVLLLALGRLALLNADQTKARDYLEASQNLAPGTEINGELGRLYVGAGEHVRGAELLAQAAST